MNFQSVDNYKRNIKMLEIYRKYHDTGGGFPVFESILYHEEVINGIGYSMDYEHKTAKVFRNVFGVQEILIPRYIIFQGEKYKVISFNECTIGFRYFKVVKFAEDSEFQLINRCLFVDTNSLLERIFLPPSIITIGESSFSECKHLQQVYIPENSKLQVIQSYAFSLSSIENINLPLSIKELQEGWCCQTQNLNSVSIHPNNQSYSNYNNYLLGKSDINQDIFDIIEFSPRNVVETTIPSFIKIISSFAFSYSSLKAITITSNVKTIKQNAFSYCFNLERVDFSENSELITIQDEAFMCSSITKISIPSSVVKIGNSAFSQCKNLKIVSFTQNSELQIIGKYSFYKCSIESITIPSSVIQIGSFAFASCDILQNVYFDKTYYKINFSDYPKTSDCDFNQEFQDKLSFTIEDIKMNHIFDETPNLKLNFSD